MSQPAPRDRVSVEGGVTLQPASHTAPEQR
jgi:hypothetical protein